MEDTGFGTPPNNDASDAESTLQALERAIAADPNRLDVRRQYGLLLYRHRRYKDAATQFFRLVKLAPDDAMSFLWLSHALFRLGLFDYARATAEMAGGLDEALLPSVSRTLSQIADKEASNACLDHTETQDNPQPVPAEIAPSLLLVDMALERPLPQAPVKPPAERITTISEKKQHPAIEAVTAWIDAALDFLTIEKSLVLRNLTYDLKFKPSKIFETGGIMFFIVIFHSMLFIFISRGFAGQIAMIPATLGAFLNWTCFSRVRARAAPFGVTRTYNKNVNIKWVHLFVADVFWDVLRVTLASVALLYFSALYLPPMFSSPFVSPNVPLLALDIFLSMFLAIGLGITMHALEERFTMMVAVDHVLVWLLYFSCGIYGSYVQEPTIMTPYSMFNPLLTITEYTRLAFDSSYPVGPLTLAYPAAAGLFLTVTGLALRKMHNTAHQHA